MLFDIVLFAGDKGLVDLQSTILHDTVIQDLVAEGEDDLVAFFDLFGGDLERFVIPDDGGALLGTQTHFFDDFVGADFVDDAN